MSKNIRLFSEYFNNKEEIIDDEWEVEEIISVSDKEPEDLEEGIIIAADFGNADISRGKKIYITARISKKDNATYKRSQIGVIETRIVNIYSSLNVLNRVNEK